MSNIQAQVDLYPYNTFRIHSVASQFIIVRSPAELADLFATSLFKEKPHLILGGGSNLLLARDFDGLVIKIEIPGITVESETHDYVTVKVGAGEVWHNLVIHCVNNDWGGIENLSLIPGTVGAAPMQNIGAYGVEISDVIKSVDAIEKTSGKLRTFTRDECLFGYRESVFKNELKDKYVISSITLTLTKNNHRLNTSYGAINDTMVQLGYHTPSVRSISEAVTKIRQEKLPDPAVIGNAGSFFKNPIVESSTFESIKSEFPTAPSYKIDNQSVKIPAAWLIEQCGWKGKRFNDAGVHERQALVLVNYGAASGEEIWELAMKIRSSVKEKFGVLLSPEVNILS